MIHSTKAIRFIVEALDHYQQHYEQRLNQVDLTEDEISELANDKEYVQAIKSDLERHLDELSSRRETVQGKA